VNIPPLVVVWLQALARLHARPGEAGVGDTVARLLRERGIDTPAKALLQQLVGDCGCDRRRAALNAWMPYQH
jgi:hypothetical protein